MKSISVAEHLISRFFTGDLWWARLRFLVILLSWVLWVILFKTAFSSKIEGFRYLIVPLGVITSVIMLAARYVQDIYNLRSYWAAFRYIFASFLGFGYPTIKIEHGKKEQDSDQLGLMEAIGGPGFLDIFPGNVVLLERLQGPSGVCGSGIHFLPRFGRIGAIVDLEEQQHHLKMLEATTKDGIKVVVRDIYFHYRLLSPPNRRWTVSNPYPYSVQAVKNYTYNRSVGKDGKITPWAIAVTLPVSSAITDYINEHQIDQITAPTQLEKDPREEIAKKIKAPGIKNRLKGVGTELTWFDIGSITAANEQVDLQRIKTWQADWNGRSAIVRAQGDAQIIAYQELGRVETQSELLKSILNSFRNVQVSDKHKENVRKIIMARTAQILESMSSLYRNHDESLVTGTQEFKQANHAGKTGELGNGNNAKEDVK